MDVFPRPRLWISGLQLLDRTIFKISGSSNHTVFPWITGKLDDSIWSFYSWENRRSKNARNGPLPSGKPTKNYGKSPFLMGKSTISMAIFNCYVSLPEGNQV